MTQEFEKEIISLPNNTFFLKGGDVLPEENGTVRWLNEKKGFGMLKDKDEGNVFVHAENIPQDIGVLKPGLSVVFEAEEKENPPRKIATSVRVLV